ncbi:MAG TPA: sensor histidine kinase [Ramlibacter sp.]|jgi:signal transduction histidine kinase
MPQSLLVAPITAETLANLRTQAREIGVLVGLEGLQQTRFSTAVSEIARNAVEHATSGSVEFLVDCEQPQRLLARITDAGPGFEDLEAVLAGRWTRAGRPALGISGSRRLVHGLTIASPASGGAVVVLEMLLPSSAPVHDAERLAAIAQRLRVDRNPQAMMEELQQQNRELLRIHQELRDKQLLLERADDFKNQFVVTLAHELRNPLSTLQMSLDVLRRKPDMSAEDVRRRHEVMQRQATQLSTLVEDLLDAARVSQGKVLLERKPSELNGLIADALEMTEGAIAAKAHRVSLQLHEGPLWVSADPSRLKQVICNLVQNSARYTPPQGSIAIRVTRQETQAVVEVADNGIGISAQDLPHIFGLFSQGGGGAERHGGLGVGLALVHRLVQDHGGTVHAASNGANQGSRFTVSLPLAAH